MASVLFVSDDPGTMVQLADGLEAAGLRVRWVAVKEAGPDRYPRPPDVVVLDGDAVGLNLVEAARAWKAIDPAPALVVWADGAAALKAVAQHGLTRVGKMTDARALAQTLQKAADGRFVGALSRGAALHAIDAAPTGDAMQDSVVIINGSRKVPIEKVKDALRVYAGAYVSASSDVELLRQHRVLTIPETNLLIALDGARTLRTVAESGVMDPGGALRLIWGLASTGIASITAEPLDDAAHPAARLVARARRRLAARRDIVAKAQTHFDILEVSPDFERAPTEVDDATRHLAVWYSPERLAGLDLGELAPTVEPYWQAIVKARATLVDFTTCKRYFYWLIERGIDLTPRKNAKAERDPEAEKHFQAGQQSLASGDAFRAVSQLASASRFDPDEPDYEAYAAWARYVAELARGGDTRAQLARDMANVERLISGRRPRPRTLYVLGMMAQVLGDLDLARLFFSESLMADPSMTPAQRALSRLQYGAGGNTPPPQRK